MMHIAYSMDIYIHIYASFEEKTNLHADNANALANDVDNMPAICFLCRENSS